MASSSRVGASGLDTAKQFFEKLAGHRIGQPRFADQFDLWHARAGEHEPRPINLHVTNATAYPLPDCNRWLGRFVDGRTVLG